MGRDGLHESGADCAAADVWMGNACVRTGLWLGFGVARPDSDWGIRVAGLAAVFR